MQRTDAERAPDSGRAVAAAALRAMGGNRQVRRFHHGDTLLADSEVEGFDDMLASAAFHVMVDGWTAAPGVLFADIVAEHVPETTVPHLVWAPPTPWEELHSVTVPGNIDVRWLLALPITESERVLIGNDGFDAAEELFSEHAVEYFDLTRPSIV